MSPGSRVCIAIHVAELGSPVSSSASPDKSFCTAASPPANVLVTTPSFGCRPAPNGFKSIFEFDL